MSSFKFNERNDDRIALITNLEAEIYARHVSDGYVLVKHPYVPMPPLLMCKVFILVLGLVQIFVNLDADLNGQGLSVPFNGDFHLPFLRPDFCLGNLNGGGGERQPGENRRFSW
jgi:hypothetical protein